MKLRRAMPLVALLLAFCAGSACREKWTYPEPPADGTDVDLDGETFAVVGVMPPGFDAPPDADAWITRIEPLQLKTRGSPQDPPR